MKTLDWKTIADTCPKSFEMWCKHFSGRKSRTIHTHWTEEDFEIRQMEDIIGHLFAFFDEKGIIVNIACDVRQDREPNETFFEWYWYAFSNSHGASENNETLPTRTEAHIAAFSKAFELLEHQQKHDE